MKKQNQKSNIEAKAARRAVMTGFPVEVKFTTPEELDAYFGDEKIVCLRCGKKYRTLGLHLKAIHGMELDEYREIYGIPWTYGLACPENLEKHSNDAKEKIASGVWRLDRYGDKAREKAHSSPRKPRQPVSDTLLARNLEKLNKGKTGEDAKRRKQASKHGTPEFKEKMRARPQVEKAKEMLRTYWKGREQTEEHVFKRTGGHKRNSAALKDEEKEK